ncbi:MAG: NAD(P)-binding protein [Leptolyngbya sp. SIO4C1]|nr:NAD(P)-binding protein [Leptolyngbya sp. SIO4C1]
MNTDVLIIGAGPTGLALACQLIRYGVRFVILDQKPGITQLSKALGVQARTLEIYEQIGLADPAVELGKPADKIRLIAAGKVHEGFDLSAMGQGMSPYPYMLVLEQSKNEQILYDYLQQHQQTVLWETTLESFSQSNTGVQAVVRRGEGESQTVHAQYLVGCDGASSQVRQSLGLSFLGSTFERLFYVADTQIDWDLDHDTLHSCLARDSFIFFFPMPGERRWRILGNLPEQSAAAQGETEMAASALEQWVQDQTGLPLAITEINWFSTYRVHTRRVDQFSQGRCFLAGDSAHVHTPAGGQGMNTGIQDAYNLAWKLAMVLQQAQASLLDTYNQERLANAKNLVDTTDKMFEFEAGSNWLVSFVRTLLLPPLAKYIFRLDLVQRGLFSLVSQIGISYPESRLSLKTSTDSVFKVRAGDRLPYVVIAGESLYERLKAPKFHLLTFTNDAEAAAAAAQAQIDETLIDRLVLPLLPAVTDAFGCRDGFSLLLRPDNHIGFIAQTQVGDRLAEYFTHCLQLADFKPAPRSVTQAAAP